MNTCKSCRFWRPYRPTGTEGLCKAHPPQVVGVTEFIEYDIERIVEHALYPWTQQDDWCGEHEEIEEG